MTTIGDRLRAERERRGLTLTDLADTTKVGKRHLQAIEQGAYDDLPGEVFAKGYVRSFAEAVGLNPEDVARDYVRERQAAGRADPAAAEREAELAARAALERLAGETPRAPGSGRGVWAIGVGVLIAGAVAGILWWTLGRDGLPGPAAPAPASEIGVSRDTPTGVVDDETPAAATTDAGPASEPAAIEAVEIAPTFEATATESVATESAAMEMPPPTPATDEPAPPTPTVESRLEIPDSGVGTGVRDRVLVGESDVFREGDVAVFWTRVLGGRPGDWIRHVWLHDGREALSMRLSIGGAHWRTNSRKALIEGSVGDWVVEARDPDDNVLARSTFRCDAAD